MKFIKSDFLNKKRGLGIKVSLILGLGVFSFGLSFGSWDDGLWLSDGEKIIRHGRIREEGRVEEKKIGTSKVKSATYLYNVSIKKGSKDSSQIDIGGNSIPGK
jgi:hypothetical protein